MERLPLHGHRILDLPTAWAGTYASRMLADMGAEVIKIEAPNSGDEPRSATFNHVNRNKYACTLDLAQPRGRELFLRLVALSDVVIEDQGSQELDDLSYDVLRSAKADIIVVSLSGHGGEAQKESVAYGDPVAGIAAAGAVGLALWHRRRTGEGQHVDVAARETMIGLVGEYVVGYSMNADARSGRLPQPLGNRHSSMAPHGRYSCTGDDQWVTVAVADDAQFGALCRAMGRPELASDTRFADVVSRYRNQDELDGIVGEWTRQRSPAAVTEMLQAAGIAAAPVLSIPALFDDPHLRARGFWESVSHPDAGTWDVDGVPWRLSRSPAYIRLPAPRFGEHNDYVLQGLLGLSEAEVRELVEAGVIEGGPDPGAQR
jgi:crotonobetainyl-CoA:carnitine CoA-transferase CaiB-like acyl-CoA transferase